MKKARRATAPNRTGLPQALKDSIASLSGMDLSDVRVHANSDKPSQLNALAFAQGSDVHVAAGQEKYLPHEAWHVQQPPGRGKLTMQVKEGVVVNDDAGIKREADSMGAEATESAPQRTDATRTTPK